MDITNSSSSSKSQDLRRWSSARWVGIVCLLLLVAIVAAIGGYGRGIQRAAPMSQPVKGDRQAPAPPPAGSVPTARWPTYTNRYFSLHFPPSWAVTDGPTGLVFSDPNDLYPNGAARNELVVSTEETAATATAAADQADKGYAEVVGPTIFPRMHLVIDRQPAEAIRREKFDGEGKEIHYWQLLVSTGATLITVDDIPDPWGQEPVTQILGTFRFLEPGTGYPLNGRQAKPTQ